jgi:prepilin-type N-terminal cleavage/methylation domain-containing protein
MLPSVHERRAVGAHGVCTCRACPLGELGASSEPVEGRRPDTRSGFTLIELLVSAVILATISAGMATVISVCLEAWRAAQARADVAQQSDVMLDAVGRDLRASFMGRQGFFVSRDDGDGRYYLELTTASRRLSRLLYLMERGAAPEENASDLAQVVYFTEPAGGASRAADGETFALYRQEICPPQRQPLDGQDLDPEKAQLLDDQAVSFRLRFWDGQAAEWVSEWNTTDSGGQARLPDAAEIVLILRDRNRERVSVARVPLSMAE